MKENSYDNILKKKRWEDEENHRGWNNMNSIVKKIWKWYNDRCKYDMICYHHNIVWKKKEK